MPHYQLSIGVTNGAHLDYSGTSKYDDLESDPRGEGHVVLTGLVKIGSALARGRAPQPVVLETTSV